MKRAEQREVISERTSIGNDMQFVRKDGPAVRVRQYVIEGDRGVRYAAELIANEAGVERAVVDAASLEELAMLIEPAARAFSLSVRLRRRTQDAGAPPVAP
jgi:hypothetical protein